MRLPAPRFIYLASIAALLLASAGHARAAKISELSQTTLMEQAIRFFTFQDPAVRYALLGSMLLGVTCGLLGSFIVVRKMALVGDALSHAVLPGVGIGFLWNMSKDPVAIFIGASVAGLLGTVVVRLIKDTTRLKEDAALGLVLASFFGVGICLMTMIQRLPTGNKSGIDKFLFGQAAAISEGDVKLMLVVTAVTLIVVAVFYKEFLVTSFDAQFAVVSGFPAQIIHYGLMLLLAFAVVIALQAVGVVLVSAMLITPAAAAYLLTDRMHRVLWLSALFGLASGAGGAFLSFLGPNFPTGPFMVLSSTSVFALAFLFGPRHGVISRWWRQRSRAARIQRENTLKSIYHVLEARNFLGEGVSLRELAERRRETVEEAGRQGAELRRHSMATLHEEGNLIFLTPPGWQLACNIVRNHRLWELYLTNAAHIAADHVHDDAEKIEHVLGDETVRQLERRLEYATKDPHGRPIPGLADIQRGAGALESTQEVVGYGKRS
ncbi:MAG TPA: iron chelate uptake ABC transporter family permease subunit [Verrucomicrobiae bacterium]|nr:iron chelate uptake ABC transporter family permease subunit [Verrucomicrobiae bacterium]